MILGQTRTKEYLEVAIEHNLPVLLVGETGVGKTSIINEMAAQHGRKSIRFSITGETTVDEFVGKYTLRRGSTNWQDGILLQAIKEGWWLIVDEINAALPEILFVLHSLLDDDKFVVVSNHEGEVVKPHKNFRFFAAMNPVDEYAGTKDLNKAFKSRFPMIIDMAYPEPKIEVEILEKRTGVPKKDAVLMVDVGLALRQAKDNDDIFYTCSTRDLIQWGELEQHLGLDDAFKVTILNKAEGDAHNVQKIYKKVTKGHVQFKRDFKYAPSFEVILEKDKELRQAKEEVRKSDEKVKKLKTEFATAKKDAETFREIAEATAKGSKVSRSTKKSRSASSKKPAEPAEVEKLKKQVLKYLQAGDIQKASKLWQEKYPELQGRTHKVATSSGTKITFTDLSSSF